MTSKKIVKRISKGLPSTQSSTCFVYIVLPGDSQSITAGRFELTHRNGIPLGRFVYGRKYLENPRAVEFDPLELILSSKTYETIRLKGVFGALRDSGPDYWGRRLIERSLGAEQLSEMDYLLQSPDDRAGALAFGLNQNPPAPKQHFNQTLDLEKLQAIADLVVDRENLSHDGAVQQIENLLLIGTSMGGARPKAVVENTEGLWLAKFNRNDDPWNNARVEHAMLSLARSCGISAAESQITSVAGRDVLLVKRFDREKTVHGYSRARMISGLTILGADDSYTGRGQWSYLNLVEELRRISSQPEIDATELFKRMCFNALISNGDDHPRNHAVIAKARGWKLSPAYDLTPMTPLSLERRDLALTIGDAGRWATNDNILSQSMRFLLTRDDAQKIVRDMETCITKSWYKVARVSGVSEKDCDLISSAFVYPGFHGPASRL